MYADDYNGQMPSSYFVSRSKNWNRRDSENFCTGAGFIATQGSVQNGTWPVLPCDHMKSTDIVNCPSDEVADPDPNTPCS